MNLSARSLVAMVGTPSTTGGGPAYRQWSTAIVAAILDGRLPDGTRLPSERSFAEAAGLSRTTTTRIYASLRERGLVTSRHGSGTTVRVPVSGRAAASMLAVPEQPGVIALTSAAMTAPPELAHLVQRALDGLPSLLATNGYLPDGLPLLRERLAQRYSEQGLPTDPEQIIVTNGAQGALALLTRTLLRPGDRVLTEACSYPHAFDTLGQVGARFLPLPFGSTPWPLEDFHRLAPAARAAYLVPDFHNPTGAVMDEEQRAAIGTALRRHEAITIIDETMRDIRIDQDTPLPHLATWHRDALTLGSASKSLWGGLRIGWLRAPRSLVPRLVQARMHHDLGSSSFDQLVVAEAVAEGLLDNPPHRETIRTRRDALIEAVRHQLPGWKVNRPRGGLSVWIELPRRAASALVIAAEEEGIRLTPGPRFFGAQPSAGEGWLRVPFVHDTAVLEDAVARLARAWRSLGPEAESAVRDPHAIDLIA